MSPESEHRNLTSENYLSSITEHQLLRHIWLILYTWNINVSRDQWRYIEFDKCTITPNVVHIIDDVSYTDDDLNMIYTLDTSVEYEHKCTNTLDNIYNQVQKIIVTYKKYNNEDVCSHLDFISEFISSYFDTFKRSSMTWEQHRQISLSLEREINIWLENDPLYSEPAMYKYVASIEDILNTNI